jgi:hypothetical protein
MSNYVLEWSRKSNSFHIQPLENTLAGNQKCFMNNTSHDYIVLMVGDQDECDRMADSWRSRLQSREENRHAVTL